MSLEDPERDFLNWLSGFIDGEGCFQITCRRRVRNGRINIAMSPEFRIELHKRDEETLHEIQQELGIGKVKPIRTRGHRTLLIAGTNNCYKLMNILSHVTFRTKKKQDFLIWKKAVELFKRGTMRTYEGKLQLAHLKDLLNSSSSAKQHKNYWSYEKIRKVLKEEVITCQSMP
jgi:hypothetical protein